MKAFDYSFDVAKFKDNLREMALESRKSGTASTTSLVAMLNSREPEADVFLQTLKSKYSDKEEISLGDLADIIKKYQSPSPSLGPKPQSEQ
jgi:hypothetical protein